MLNTATVAAGSLVGLALGHAIPTSWQSVALTALGLVNMALGVKMFFSCRNVLVVAAALALGGILGAALGISPAVNALAEYLQRVFGFHGQFAGGLVTASVLFCVGPMTLLGCIQDAVHGESDLLRLKSLLDGIASVFLAATLGLGVLVSAVVVLLFQGGLTLIGARLQSLAQDETLLAEITATGGAMILAIGLNLADVKHIAVETYLPAMLLVPWFNRIRLRYLPDKA